MHGRADARSVGAEEHLRLLAEMDSLALSDSCCEICHCDCYSSHRSSLDSERRVCVGTYGTIHAKPLPRTVDNKEKQKTSKLAPQIFSSADPPSFSINHNISKKRLSRKLKGARKKNAHEATAKKNSNSMKHSSIQAITSVSQKSKSAKDTPKHSGRTSPSDIIAFCTGSKTKRSTSIAVKRSKSVSSVRSRSPSPLTTSVRHPAIRRATYYTRDCKILQDLLSALKDNEHNVDTTSLQVRGKSVLRQSIDDVDTTAATQSNTLPRCGTKSKESKRANDGVQSFLTSQKLCASMASLCLAPTVREAYHHVPAHDKRILNRMAHKRTERAIAKENAWLARKYWENERYERELFKCAQMEEYKRAIRDKQFQDYLLTKARLNEIAQRDLTELQRLREALNQKEINTKRRLDALRVERGIVACQRRCGELRRAEAVAVQQEEKQIDEKLRKQEIYARLSERLQRAEQMRSGMLESYLRRLRYDNYMEELVHEEHWREAQQQERERLTQLEEQIQQKSIQSQRFIEARQRRQEAITKTAKVSASLRELVRNSVTPDTGAAGDAGGVGNVVSIENTAAISKALLDSLSSKRSTLP